MAAQSSAASVVTAFAVAALVATVIGYMRLSLQARMMTLTLGKRSLAIDDGVSIVQVPLSDLRRLLIVHDGASARIAVDSAPSRVRCSVGALYRHNSVERFVAEVPAPAQRWLEASGLVNTTSVTRGVLRSGYRATGRRLERHVRMPSSQRSA
ncbi:hypothetical protein [Leucobacter japonicus]|uniref:hypothetical protein n=1 Tax=Leucobacter japonicus TaxID=1461259 RepID=UPI0006A7709F|nr:hypothetical protein [Leucobacter japonicus]